MSGNMTELESFNASLVRVGTLTLTAGIIANFIPAVYLFLVYGTMPSLATLGKIWLLVGATFGVGWLVQPISFFPILGTSGSYIAWLAGSVADIRTPASTMAQKTAGVEAGTVEGDMISTLGISTSVFVSVFMITVFTFIGAKVIPILPEFVKESFKYILPAVFAGVYVDLTSKNLKLGLATFVLCVAVIFGGSLVKLPSIWNYLLAVVGGIALGVFFYRLEEKKTEA